MDMRDLKQSLPAIAGVTPSTRPFKYSLLRDAHIRLIHLNVGARNDGLSIQIQENVYLETAPVYEALSYTWGESRKERSISCGSENIAITANLASALVQLRNTDQSRTLWIDQICINQIDVHERNQQVALMHKIYSKAENVVIWLGEEGPDDGMEWRSASYHGCCHIYLLCLPAMELRSKVLSPGRHFQLLGLLLGSLFLRFSVAHTSAGRGSYKKLR